MSLVLQSSGGGQITLQEPATASNFTLNLPAVTGTVLVPNNASALTLGTAQNSTSGTSIDFTGIPSWAKRITVMFNGVSTNGTSNLQIQLGTGGGPTYTTSGYNSYTSSVRVSGIQNGGQVTTGFGLSASTAATSSFGGQITISNLSGNTWAENGFLSDGSSNGCPSGGSVSLAAALTAVRITTVNGTDTFDAGSINIMWE